MYALFPFLMLRTPIKLNGFQPARFTPRETLLRLNIFAIFFSRIHLFYSKAHGVSLMTVHKITINNNNSHDPLHHPVVTVFVREESKTLDLELLLPQLRATDSRRRRRLDGWLQLLTSFKGALNS